VREYKGDYMSKIIVISLGGSIIVPDKIDTVFLRTFKDIILRFLEENKMKKIILVCGGGSPAREYQRAYKEITLKQNPTAEDWIGIEATKLNASLLKYIFFEYCFDEIVINPTNVPQFTGRILIASGWKPGFSTDFDAVLLAERFSAKKVINLSNISKVFTKDPKKHSDATPIDRISWKDFKKIVGDTWIPGKNVPFDPVATKRAEKNKQTVIIASGKNTDNLVKILEEKPFEGTIIGPE